MKMAFGKTATTTPLLPPGLGPAQSQSQSQSQCETQSEPQSESLSLEPKSRHKFCAAKKWQKCVYWPNAQQLIDYEAGEEGGEKRKGANCIGNCLDHCSSLAFWEKSLPPLPLPLPLPSHTCRIRNNVRLCSPFVVSVWCRFRVVRVAMRHINKLNEISILYIVGNLFIKHFVCHCNS